MSPIPGTHAQNGTDKTPRIPGRGAGGAWAEKEGAGVVNKRETEIEAGRGTERKRSFLCVPQQSGVLRVFNLEMDRSRMWLYEAS